MDVGDIHDAGGADRDAGRPVSLPIAGAGRVERGLESVIGVEPLYPAVVEVVDEDVAGGARRRVSGKVKLAVAAAGVPHCVW